MGKWPIMPENSGILKTVYYAQIMPSIISAGLIAVVFAVIAVC